MANFGELQQMFRSWTQIITDMMCNRLTNFISLWKSISSEEYEKHYYTIPMKSSHILYTRYFGCSVFGFFVVNYR